MTELKLVQHERHQITTADIISCHQLASVVQDAHFQGQTGHLSDKKDDFQMQAIKIVCIAQQFYTVLSFF